LTGQPPCQAIPSCPFVGAYIHPTFGNDSKANLLWWLLNNFKLHLGICFHPFSKRFFIAFVRTNVLYARERLMMLLE